MRVPRPIPLMGVERSLSGPNIYDKEQTAPGLVNYDPMMIYSKFKDPVAQANSQTKKVKAPIEQYPCYLALAVDPNTGKIVQRSSANLRQVRGDILSEASTKLGQYLQEFGSQLGFAPLEANSDPYQHKKQQPSSRQKENAPRPNKKRKGSSDANASDEASQDTTSMAFDEDPVDTSGSKDVQFRADAKADWEKWFTDAFRAVQQVSCRVIAKEWIKTIHPKKQSTHPYNGKNPRTGERGDSNSTKPPYWPRDVIHKEPDHINKEARTKLLVHLLMNTPHQEMSISGDSRSEKEITAETLLESLEQKRGERGMTELRKKFSIVQQIIEVRSMLEQYEMGGLPGDATVTAQNYSDFNRGGRNDDDSDFGEDSVVTDQDELRPDDWEPSGTTQQDLRSNTYEQTEQHRGSTKKRPKKDNADRRTSQCEDNTMSATSISHPITNMDNNSFGLHPPMITPAWDTYQASSHSGVASGQMGHRQHVSPTIMAEHFNPSLWHGQLPHGLDTSSQYHDQMMLSPPPPSMMNSAYMDAAFSSIPHTDMTGSHPSHFGHHMQGGRQMQHMRGPSPYDTYMSHSIAQSSRDDMHQAYFS